MKKQYFLIVDTETTMNNLVADFGAVICDRQGNIVNECAILVNGVYTDTETSPLYYDDSGVFSRDNLATRYASYNRMLDNGSRMIASVGAINRWLEKAKERYNPTLTAYNLAFDLGKCRNTGINLDIFEDSFCLWAAAYSAYAHKKAFRQMVLDTHAFNAVTKQGNMSYKTNAEIMTRFVKNNPNLEDEPHTALEDAKYYELPILTKLLKSYKKHWLINESQAYSWRDVQVKDWFRPL